MGLCSATASHSSVCYALKGKAGGGVDLRWRPKARERRLQLREQVVEACFSASLLCRPPLGISDGARGTYGTFVARWTHANGTQGPLSCNGLIPPLSDPIRSSGGIKYVKERGI